MPDSTLHTVNEFSQQYCLLRKKEGRIYSDEEVGKLPGIDRGHQHWKEWLIRKDSCAKLMSYLDRKKRPLQILEIGCGNGWLSANLSAIPDVNITAIDINTGELEQAKRVFNQIRNIQFFNCSLEDDLLKGKNFDMIIFAASIQYFSSLKDILNKALSILDPAGEIHIIDSNFYKKEDIDAARQRSDAYYRSVGFPGMSDQYFQHLLEDIKGFNYKILNDPHSFINKLKKNNNPFYWVRIKGNA